MQPILLHLQHSHIVIRCAYDLYKECPKPQQEGIKNVATQCRLFLLWLNSIYLELFRANIDKETFSGLGPAALNTLLKLHLQRALINRKPVV